MGFSRQEYWEWVAISYSRGSSQPRDQTWVSCRQFFTTEPPNLPWRRRINREPTEVRGCTYPLWSKQWCRLPSPRPCGGQKPGSGRRLLTAAAPPARALFAQSRSGYCLGGTLLLGQSHCSSSSGLPWRGCWGPCGGSGCPGLKGNTNTYVPKAAGMMTWTWWRGQQCFKAAALQGPERKSWIVLRFYG